MNAYTKVYAGDPGKPGLDLIEMAWGFRLRPADMKNQSTDAVIEWSLTFLGIILLISAFGQWVLPGSLYGGDMLMMKFVLTAILGLCGGVVLSVSARGFRPEVQVDRIRQEIRFVSRNPRGRGKVLATVDLDQIVGVGVTRSIDGPDCHCLIYMIDGEKPLRIASGTEPEIKAIRNRMNGIVVSPADRVAAKLASRQPERKSVTPDA
jgi:hypothetical protein